jgi:hypothetical protein
MRHERAEKADAFRFFAIARGVERARQRGIMRRKWWRRLIQTRPFRSGFETGVRNGCSSGRDSVRGELHEGYPSARSEGAACEVEVPKTRKARRSVVGSARLS